MRFKTPFKKIFFVSGITLIELVIVVGVIMILTGVSYSLMSSSASKSKARDNTRLSDISNIDRAINEYRIDRGAYPGDPDTLYTSIVLPAGSTALYNSNLGWIKADLSGYMSKGLTDPTNDETYHYEYYHDSAGYELSTRLESAFDKAESDGGNNTLKYELGNNLILID